MREYYISGNGIVPINFSHIAVTASTSTGLIGADAHRFKIKPAYLLKKGENLSDVVFDRPPFHSDYSNEHHIYTLLELFGIMWMSEIYDALNNESVIHVQHSILGKAIRKSNLEDDTHLAYYPHSLSGIQDVQYVSVSALNAYVHTMEAWSMLDNDGEPSLRIVITPNPEWMARYRSYGMDFEFIIPHRVFNGRYDTEFSRFPFFEPPRVNSPDSIMVRYIKAADFHKSRLYRNVDFSGASLPI